MPIRNERPGRVFIDPALAVSVEEAWRAYRWKEQESDAGLGRRILFAMNDTAGIGISRKILFGAAIIVTVAGACGAFWMTIAGAAKGICLLALALSLCVVAGGGRPSGWIGSGPAAALSFLAAFACVATHPGFAGGGGRLDGAASIARAVTLGVFGLWASVFAAYAYVRERRRAGKAGDAAIMWGPMVLTGGGASGAAYGAMLLPESRTVGAALGAISMLGAAAVAWVVFWAIRGTGVTMSPRRRDAARSRARERAASETATGGAECETGVGTPDGMETGIVNEAAGGRAAYAGGPAGAEGAAGGPGAGVAAAWNARAARAAALGCAACFLIPVPIVAIRWFRYEGTVREGLGKFESGDIAGAAAAFREAGSLMAALGDPRPLAAAQERVSNVLEARGDFAGSRAAWLARLRTLGLPGRGDLRLVAMKLASGDDGEFWDIFVRRGEAVFSDPRMCAAVLKRAESAGVSPRILYAAAAARLARGDRGGAISFLRRLLAARPDDGCALYMLEIILRMEGREVEADAERRKRHNIYVRDMAGDMTCFPNIMSDFAARMYLPPGRYSATCRVLGTEARGEWPILEVYLDDSIIYSTQVRRPEWHETGFEFEVERGGSFLLRLVYPNDLYEVSGNTVYNRNLMLEAMSIEPVEGNGARGGRGEGS